MMDKEYETAALEGYLLGEAKRLLIRARALTKTNSFSGEELRRDIDKWRLAMSDLVERWQEG